MAKLDIEFRWSAARDGYRIVREDPPTILRGLGDPDLDDPRRIYIVPATTDERPIQPFALKGDLYLEFARLSETPEACVDFALAFGLLRHRLASARESFDYWLRQIRALREAIEIARDDPIKVHFFVPSDEAGFPLRDVPYRPLLRAWPMPAGGRRTVIQMQPVSLIDGLWLQFLHSLSEDREIGTCERCGTWFERGIGTDRGRRARFCTDACRINFHNANRGKGEAA